MAKDSRTVWYKALEPDELAEGRVTPKTLGTHTVCMTHFEGCYAALSNKCPHQGGPLGEGSIENGWLRCPWHGWDYHPIDRSVTRRVRRCRPELSTLEVREDGVYVGFEEEVDSRDARSSDVMAETMVTSWGVKQRLWHGRSLEPGAGGRAQRFRERVRQACRYVRYSPRGRSILRLFRLRQAHGASGGMS